MPYLIGVFLIVAWFAAVTASYTMGGFIHILLAVAIVMFLIRIFSDPWPSEMRKPRFVGGWAGWPFEGPV